MPSVIANPILGMTSSVAIVCPQTKITARLAGSVRLRNASQRFDDLRYARREVGLERFGEGDRREFCADAGHWRAQLGEERLMQHRGDLRAGAEVAHCFVHDHCATGPAHRSKDSLTI